MPCHAFSNMSSDTHIKLALYDFTVPFFWFIGFKMNSSILYDLFLHQIALCDAADRLTGCRPTLILACVVEVKPLFIKKFAHTAPSDSTCASNLFNA